MRGYCFGTLSSNLQDKMGEQNTNSVNLSSTTILRCASRPMFRDLFPAAEGPWTTLGGATTRTPSSSNVTTNVTELFAIPPAYYNTKPPLSVAIV